MNRRSIQTSALGLAAMITLSMLTGMNLLATQPHAQLQMEIAEKAASMQVVVVQAKRTTRS
jgi:hypothetical protein